MQVTSATDAVKPKTDWAILSWMVLVHAVAALAPFFFSWGALITCVILYFVTGMFGITLGYHRLLTHRSFKTPKWVERFLATLGVLALQGSPREWVAHHRMHHAKTDTPDDPHDARSGFWHSHIGWLFKIVPKFDDKNLQRRFARDIVADPYLNWLSGWGPQIGLQVGLGLALLAFGGWSYVIWGIFLRLVIVYHVTWTVNSLTHMWGYRNYETNDLSRNNFLVGIWAFGEGWHNNHHAQQDVAPAGRRWWEFDLTWQVIKLMRFFGLAYDIKMPPVEDEAPKTAPAPRPVPAPVRAGSLR